MNAPESAIGNEQVKVYPVRTPLSRVLTASAAAYVDVLPRLDARVGARLPDGVADVTRTALTRLAVPAKGKISFRFDLTADGPRRDFDDQLHRLLRDLVEGGGFALGQVTTTAYRPD